MAHPRFAAREAVDQERPHEAPAQAGAVADGVVDLLRGGDPVLDEPQGLAPQGFEQPVGHEAVDLLAHPQYPHADALVEGRGALLRGGRGALPAADLDEGQQVDRVERVADDEPFRMRHPGAEPRRQQARGRGGDHHVRRRRGVDLGEHPDLQVFHLGQALDDEARARRRLGDRAGDAQDALRHVEAGHQLRHGAAGVGQHRVELAGELRVGVEDRAVMAVQQEARRPAGADDAAADEADALLPVHAGLRSFNSSRVAAGPITLPPMAVRIVAARSTSAPLVAGTPRSSHRLSSSPTRTLPPAMAAMAT